MQAKIDGIGKKLGLFSLSNLINSQESVGKHGRWIIQKRRRENEGDPFRVQLLEPELKLRTTLLGKPGPDQNSIESVTNDIGL